jgi:two-component system, chemotaxis family, protein-glutamate methylesterase/glutaminase
LSDTFDALTVPATHAIVVGASAGGLDAVRTLLGGFPESVPAAIFVVIHTSPNSPGLLAAILDRWTKLPVVMPDDGETIRSGWVYVAKPDYHLVIGNNRVHLSHGPREHRFRPAIDPLFRTAAEQFGPRSIGVVLSGNMADGTHGSMRIKRAGGVTIVQDPDQAQMNQMPLNAMRRVGVDYVLPVEEMTRVILGLVMNGRENSPRKAAPKKQIRIAKPTPERPDSDALRTGAIIGSLSPLTCPDCGGSLWESTEDGVVQYRCHVGHGFTADSLRDGIEEKLEDTLWSAVRALEEAIELRKRMLHRAGIQRLTDFVLTLKREMAELEKNAESLRALLLNPRSGDRRAHRRKRKVNGQKAG